VQTDRFAFLPVTR